MKKEVYELKKSEYFKDNEDIFIRCRIMLILMALRIHTISLN